MTVHLSANPSPKQKPLKRPKNSRSNLNANLYSAHSAIPGAGIPIAEYLYSLGALPDTGFRFHPVPARIRAFGTFPVRPTAYITYNH